MPKVEVVHLSSPLCQWSWGYEPVINRLRMRYGKQIDITVAMGIPYVSREQWLTDYGMSAEEALAWTRDDVVPAIRMPTAVPRSWSEMPASCVPPAIAVKAAGIVHGPAAERRLSRALMHAAYVEGLDTSDDKVIGQVVEACGLDNARMGACAATEAPGNAIGEDGARAGHGANFFSLLVRDGSGTVVSLPQAYDAARVEAAIAYMSGGKAKPRALKPDVVAYARENGPVPLVELRSVFGLDAAKAKALVAKGEKAGALERVAYPLLPRTPFWRATESATSARRA